MPVASVDFSQRGSTSAEGPCPRPGIRSDRGPLLTHLFARTLLVLANVTTLRNSILFQVPWAQRGSFGPSGTLHQRGTFRGSKYFCNTFRGRPENICVRRETGKESPLR
jgi:hypothetical protein